MDNNPCNFKDFVATDIEETFFNQEEFADIISIEDKDVPVVIDETALQKYNANLVEGVSKGEVLFFVPVNLVELYEEQIIWHKNKRYMVDDIKDESGIYRVVLVGYQS